MSRQGQTAGSQSGGVATASGAGPVVDDRPRKGSSKVGGRSSEPGVPAGARRAERQSVFEVYKRGQGYYTRMGTAVGGGILILAGADFLYRQLDVFDTNAAWTLWLRVGIPIAMVVGLGLLLFWVVGVNRKTCDFMIATEGEMKKVSWSSKRELIGSTKVVILFSILIAALLFVTDIAFIQLFGAIKVLKVAPSLF